MSTIEQLRSTTGIDNFNTVSQNEYSRLQQLVADGKISNEQINQIISLVPNFIDLQKEYVGSLKETISAAKENQKQALVGISASLEGVLNVINTIALRAETEELRSKVVDVTLKLAEYSLQVAKIIQETNEENNNTWKYITAAGAAGLFFVARVFFGRNSSSSRW